MIFLSIAYLKRERKITYCIHHFMHEGKGKGNCTGQLIGEQCNSPLIQSTLHAPLRQSKLFAPFLCNYFKQFCALILLRKELI